MSDTKYFDFINVSIGIIQIYSFFVRRFSFNALTAVLFQFINNQDFS